MADDVVKAQPPGSVMDGWAASHLAAWAAGGKGGDKIKDGLTRDMKRYAAELAGAAPTPVESLLAETAALCWFALRLHEAHFAGASSSGEGMTFNQGRYHLTKIDRAHARLMATLKTLATVRRLAVPAVQVNIARRQVNQQVNAAPRD
ncbi:MAG: hypothetical protein LC745_13535 [Planctomycetia bacterium]|nr:hypothetical protein [Planctomycetia bacterium]